MESDRLDPAEARRIAARVEAAPYVDYPPTPRWYPPLVGAWAAGLAALLTLSVTSDREVTPALLALVVLELVFLRWLVRRQGALPSFRRPPTEFRTVLRRYLVGVVVIVVAVVVAGSLAGPVVAAVVAFVATTAGIALHERSYARAAARTRARLA